MRFGSTLPFAALPLSLALFAVFRFVDESLLMKELLFSRRKYKLQTTTHTEDISVNKRHDPPSKLSRLSEGSTRTAVPSVKTGSVSGIVCPFNLENMFGICNNCGLFFAAKQTLGSPSETRGFVIQWIGAACGDLMSSLLSCQSGLQFGSFTFEYFLIRVSHEPLQIHSAKI